jgi:hypothetical protein
MRRKVGAVVLAAGLFAAAACGDNNGNGGGSTEEVCDKIDTEGLEAFERFEAAGVEINAALQEGDDAAALVAVSDAQAAADDIVEVLRDGADEAEDEELSTALTNFADEFETFLGGLDPEALAAGEVPDTTDLDAAGEEVDAICAAAA